MRDFLGTTTFSTSSNEQDDIANSAFVRLEKEIFPAGMAFVAFANGERPARNIERASFAGFNLKRKKNREANIGLTVNRPTWHGSVTSFFSRIDDHILIYQGIRSENVDVHRIGVELDFTKQLTPFWTLFGSMAWIRAQNLTGHGSGSVPLAQTPPLDSRLALSTSMEPFPQPLEDGP